MKEEGIKATVIVSEGKSSKSNEQEYDKVDPIKDLNLGEQAWKVEQKDVSDTEKEAKGIDLNYYVLRGGEVMSKQFTENGKAVLFNKGLANEFEIPLNAKEAIWDDPMNRWYSSEKYARGLAKVLVEKELQKAKQNLDRHQKAYAFLEQQLEKDMF
ncbi:MAG TPA: hypothetical protein VMZ29_00040 [Candidatus Bathyarchaeia archaeon]|nr:hypothetical protein [Candidatus Bathyarchaeia archaeon]